ncbi:hypothetical protein [Acinetobacter sp.]|uniref:hypothetical protein n=1 Tax=Acinetobacter sp. TaxID=472 RepID=UPI0035B011F5
MEQIFPAMVNGTYIDALNYEVCLGSGDIYTYQSVGTGTVVVYGSNNKVDWIKIVTLTGNDSAVLQHSWRFLKINTTNSKLLLNRGR